MTTIATTQSGWKAKMYFSGKARDWVLTEENEHKKRATSVGAEITQSKALTKNNIVNYNTDVHSKEVVISCL